MYFPVLCKCLICQFLKVLFRTDVSVPTYLEQVLKQLYFLKGVWNPYEFSVRGLNIREKKLFDIIFSIKRRILFINLFIIRYNYNKLCVIITFGCRDEGFTGNIFANGVAVDSKNSEIKDNSCYIMQDDYFNPFFTVQESMMLAAKIKLGNSLNTKSKLLLVSFYLSVLSARFVKFWYFFKYKLIRGQRWKEVAVPCRGSRLLCFYIFYYLCSQVSFHNRISLRK